jgi:hypothetical protein
MSCISDGHLYRQLNAVFYEFSLCKFVIYIQLACHNVFQMSERVTVIKIIHVSIDYGIPGIIKI